MSVVVTWPTAVLGRYVELINGYAFPSDEFTEGEGMPLIRIRDLNHSDTEVNFCGKFTERYVVRKSDLLIGMDGDFSTIRWRGNEALLNQRVCKLVTKDEALVSQEFLFYRIIDEIKAINRITAATTVKHLSSKDVLEIVIELPSKPEQTKIAEILSTVDRAIEQTEALIAKQQRLKTGLMQDLLTRGIDEHGNLRSEETHEFKDSPMGRIPVEWEVRRIDELLAKVDPPMRSGPFGSALLKEELVESGIPLLGIDNVHVERFVSDFTRFVEPKKAKSLKRYLVRPGDIMITIMGTVGRCCVVPDDIGPALSSKHTWTISVDPSRYSPYLACLQVNHASWVLQHFAQGEQGGIMASIKADTLRSTLLPVPPPDEMLKIESLLKAVSAKISVEQDNLEKNRAVKTALMQDLLTGRKRILASSGELSARNQKVKINE